MAGTGGDAGTSGQGGDAGTSGAGGEMGGAGAGGDSGAGGAGGAEAGGAGAGGAGAGGAGQGGAGAGGAGAGGAGAGGAGAGGGGAGGAGTGGAGTGGAGAGGATGFVVQQVTMTSGGIYVDFQSGVFRSPLRSYLSSGIRFIASDSTIKRLASQDSNGDGIEDGFAPVAGLSTANVMSWLSLDPSGSFVVTSAPARDGGLVQTFKTDGFTTTAASAAYKVGSGAPLDATDAHTAEVHPSSKYIYAALGKDSTLHNSHLVGLGLGSDGSLTPQQDQPLEGEGATGLVIRPDGGALYAFNSPAGGVQRFTIDAQGMLTPGAKVVGDAATQQGAVCRLGGVDHVYAPVLRDLASSPDQGGVLHLSFADDGSGSLTKKYAVSGPTPGLASVRHVLANKDCTVLFVGGNALENGKYRPTIHAFAIHQQTGALALRATYQDDTSGVTIPLDAPPLLSFNPTESILYAVGDGSKRFLSLHFTVDGQSGGAAGGPAQLVVTTPESEQQAVVIAFGNTPPVYERCPPGELLTSVGGTVDTSAAGPYGQTLGQLWIGCSRFDLTPTSPPTLQTSPGYRSAAHFSYNKGASWQNACKPGDVVVGARAAGKPSGQETRVVHLHVLCAPVTLITGSPSSLWIDTSKTYAGSTDPIQDGQLFTAFKADGTPIEQGDCFASVGLGLTAESFPTNGALPTNITLLCGAPSLATATDGCAADTDCTSPADPCHYARCVDGACLVGRRPGGWPVASQTDASCILERCNAQGTTAFDPLPLAATSGECWSCDENTGKWASPQPGAACKAAGSVCAPTGACVGAWP
jgi:hypothetical protein